MLLFSSRPGGGSSFGSLLMTKKSSYSRQLKVSVKIYIHESN